MRQRAIRLAFVAAVLGAAPFAGAFVSSGTGRAVANPVHAGADLDPVQHERPLGFNRFPRQLALYTKSTARRHLVVHKVAKRAKAAHAMRFRWPVEGTVTTPFIPSGPLEHDGIDIADLRSLTVTAAIGGEVIQVGYTTGFEGCGNIVDVEVAPGVETLYAHLSAMNVQIGDHVTTGQTLGTAGCTGMCTGTHLHFEVRENGTPVDPMQFLH